MTHPPSKQAFGPTVNRIADLMAHTNRYAFQGIEKLGRDTGVDPSYISRIIRGMRRPSLLVIARIAGALERELGVMIDPRDIIAENGAFLTRSACDLAGCRGCLPDAAYDEFGDLKSAYTGVGPGTWVTSRYPKGFIPNPPKEDHVA